MFFGVTSGFSFSGLYVGRCAVGLLVLSLININCHPYACVALGRVYELRSKMLNIYTILLSAVVGLMPPSVNVNGS